MTVEGSLKKANRTPALVTFRQGLNKRNKVGSYKIKAVSCRSVSQSYLTLPDLMDCSTLGLPVHHQLPELTQAHVHQAGDAMQPSHPLLFPTPPAFNLF